MNPELDRIEKVISYQFRNPELLIQALTHRSVSGKHNERLEFLGDSVLNFTIAAELYDQFPSATEGELSRLRASLVKEDSLAELARSLNLGDFLILGSGELKSGGYRRASILSDALEAIIGSIYLDSGYDSAAQFILRLYQERLKTISPDENLKDPKSLLQEFLQSHKISLPEYRVVSIEGVPHDQLFRVECRVEGLAEPCIAEGNSRRKAEQASAKLALVEIKRKFNG